MQSSRSKLMTCAREGLLLKFQSIRTATSDRCMQKQAWKQSLLLVWINSNRRLQIWKLYTVFSVKRYYDMMVVKARLSSLSESGEMGSIPSGCWNSLQPSAILDGTEPFSALTCSIQYCCALYVPPPLLPILLVAISYWWYIQISRISPL